MISALAWVPRGVAKQMPQKAEPSEEELEAMRLAAESEAAALDDRDEDEEEEEEEKPATVEDRRAALQAASALGQVEDSLAELDMDNYDEEEDPDEVAARLFAGAASSGRVYESNTQDPHMTAGGDEDSDEEVEDFTFKKSDLIILGARTEDDVSTLEVWVYEEASGPGEEANIYVHHDLMLHAFPLSLAWMDCNPQSSAERSNYVAIGTFRPEIEIWNLDVLDAVEPAYTLGGAQHPGEDGGEAEGEGKKKKKKKKKAALKEGSHSDAVLTLDWNSGFRNVLASGSADKTVKVWDIAQQRCDQTLAHHTDKVQAVCWNPQEKSVLLTGAFDMTAHLADVRSPSKTFHVKLTADVECVSWDLANPHCFLVSTEDGLVVCHDARKLAGMEGGASQVYTLAAHDKAACALSFCPAAPALLATASTDKTVKLWDTAGGVPSLLHKQDVEVGAVFAAGFSNDSPFLLAAAGSKGQVNVWDTLTCPAVAQKYGRQAAAAAAAAAKA